MSGCVCVIFGVVWEIAFTFIGSESNGFVTLGMAEFEVRRVMSAYSSIIRGN